MKNILLLALMIFCGIIPVCGIELLPLPTELRESEQLVAVGNLPVVKKMLVKPFSGGDTLGDEGYILAISDSQVSFIANKPAGFFYARKTWEQIKKQAVDGKVHKLYIRDVPKTSYRVFMLDSGRQYHKVSTIKKILDMMADLKLNIFHWHLTENTGWRIPIAKYPRLTEIGSAVGKEPEQSGFYTREEIKEIIAYARERFITVVPEIDLPGHADAALNAYPQWACLGNAPKINNGISQVIFCGAKEESLQAMKDILSEVAEIFPSPYIHIGGDEAPKKEWDKCPACQAKIKALGIKNSHELQVVLMKELAEHLKQYGKQSIVWNDAVVAGSETKLPAEIIVQYWNMRGDKGLKNLKFAKDCGHRIVFTPNSFSYLNFPYKPWKGYGKDRILSVGTCIDLAKLPDGISPFGAGAALWCDYNLTENLLEDRLYPRIFILADFAWNQKVPADKAAFEKQIHKITLAAE